MTIVLLLVRFQLLDADAQDCLKVTIRSQGFTEGNMAWHACFVEILE
jgi:hypothetical protein